MNRLCRTIVECTFFVLLLSTAATFARIITDEQLGYSITIPDTWIREAVDANHHRFVDTSGSYGSIVVIDRYDFAAAAIYESPVEWTRANFIAYMFSIDADPLCAMLFYDTVTAMVNDTIRAMDAFTYYYDIDSAVGDWAEYIRFAATGTHGFELYAIGPQSDLDSNVEYYLTIIESITLQATDIGVIKPRQRTKTHTLYNAAMNEQQYICNLRGQRIGKADAPAQCASQILCRPRCRLFMLK